MGSTGGRVVCITHVHLASTLLQLETRSISRGNRCLQPAMRTAESSCELSLVPNLQGSHTSEEPSGSDNSHSSSMDGLTLVPYSAGMLYDYPRQLPCSPSLFQQVSDMKLMDLLPQPAIWPISGRSLDVTTFQSQLKSLPFILEEQNIPSL